MGGRIPDDDRPTVRSLIPEEPSSPEETITKRISDVEELGDDAAQSIRDMPYLVVLAGQNVGHSYRLVQSETTIGRGTASDVRLLDDGVSRKHAQILFAEGIPRLRDLGSVNGLFVNGEAVSDERVLEDGDKIRLGGATVLKFTYSDRLDETFRQQMLDAALRDPLTSTFNRAYLEQRLESEWAYAQRHRSSVVIIMIDVDHFKRINDTYGHIAGDVVLSRIAKRLAWTLRAEDILARYGGEEFCVVCRNIPLESATLLAERLREVVAKEPIDAQGASIEVTASFGVAAFPEMEFGEPEALLDAADRALVRAKREGRNRVVVADAKRGG